MEYAFHRYGSSLSKTSRTDIEGRLAEAFFSEKRRPVRRASEGRGCRPGNAARIERATGRAGVRRSRCGARGSGAPLLALRHSANTSSFPVALAFFRKEGVEAGPVRNLKERWGVGTESCKGYSKGVFGKAAKLFFYKRILR